MLVLLETPAGYGLFKVEKASLLDAEPGNISDAFSSSSKAQKLVSLHAFHKFDDTKSALEATTALIESRLDKSLKKFLKRQIVDKEITEQLAVCDKALGGLLKKKLDLNVVYSQQATELIRGIRANLEVLLEGVSEKDLRTMSLSLAHTLNRFKLKFSPDKVDTMVVQAVGLLDDLDRELNNFAMRLKEWYGWHFPELAKIVTDNLTYAKAVMQIGFRSHCKEVDLSVLLTDEIEKEVKDAAEISMGTDITETDLGHIRELAERVAELVEYRGTLAEYLKNRMQALAPNLTHMVGELVGARLVAHAGSLVGLAKHPASTVQILGAEKALFRALKTKKATPKYGLIYHASLVGQSAPKLKGKISRVLASKLALCTRVDALADQTEPTVAIGCKKYVEKRLEQLSDEVAKGSAKSFQRPQTGKYVPQRDRAGRQYDPSADDSVAMGSKGKSAGAGPKKRSAPEDDEDEVQTKKKKVQEEESEDEEEDDDDEEEEDDD
uniref:Nop domain-containing protein n=1 Tax=Chromera velia CCMP2878 TaxID=1169474 RepID=A0A0G4IEY9_9ALVE|mmetsp:Transcript_47778/g.94280  ORF Transcript_47778/g.94280 Transcript_47778/m.94280 type:complete len:495 (-) Transcript_47778:377-1861(-)|eukprot:Cvel_13899.t1-p1 / transcript=Cvel_13899.t1 / gene=Cvel_13899 / organism=Chromera_velia_CCMP2878 / gene_product=Nucleolar protein 58, putative / transcript_product=Nucleolar protein 58, putative / location=Cvel_scaffold968:26787-31598(+) / protein_length=494 / sequence_SO=supercontig / SO=protein_coding / is_pseudo=false